MSTTASVLTIDTTPPCDHLAGTDDALVYRPPERRDGDLTFACPCCGAVAHAAPHERLGPCPPCDVMPVEVTP